MRLGFLVAPASLQPALHAAKQLTDWHGELTTQAALARFIDQGLLVRHIRKVAREHGNSRVMGAGLHLSADVVPGKSVDIAHVVRRAEEGGVRVSALSAFSATLLCGRDRIDEGL